MVPNGMLANRRVRSLAAFVWMTVLVATVARSLPGTYDVRDNDFCAYYDAGQIVGQGQCERLYDSDLDPDHNTFTNLPIVSLLLVPMGRMPYAIAWHVFWWLQLLSYMATAGLLLLAVRRFFGPLTMAPSRYGHYNRVDIRARDEEVFGAGADHADDCDASLRCSICSIVQT